MPRTRPKPTEERELLPLHRPSTSTIASPQHPPLSPPPPRRSSLTANSPPPTAAGNGYKRRDTPHDAALAHLSHRLRGGDPGSANDVSNSPAPLHSTPHSRRSHPPLTSSPSHPRLHESLYDPYTGQYQGQLLPMSRPQPLPPHSPATTSSSSASSIKTSSSSSSSDKEDDFFTLHPPPDVNILLSPEEKKREEDLWANLARIRRIQSEVSKKHLSLEAFQTVSNDKMGAEQPQQGGPGATVSPRGSISRRSGRETTAAGGTTSDDTSVKNDNTLKRSARTPVSAGFASTTAQTPPPKDAFAQRREAIDEIVKQLDDLSIAVKQLHTKPSPPNTASLHAPSSTTPPPQQPHPQQLPSLQIPTSNRPAGGFGWRSPSTSSYNAFKDKFNAARNKQQQQQQQQEEGGLPQLPRPTHLHVQSPSSMQRSATAPTSTMLAPGNRQQQQPLYDA